MFSIKLCLYSRLVSVNLTALTWCVQYYVLHFLHIDYELLTQRAKSYKSVTHLFCAKRFYWQFDGQKVRQKVKKELKFN